MAAFRIMINNNESDFIIAKYISEVIRTRKSKKDRQLNDQMTNDKRTNIDLQTTTQK
jgi:hypothetical protein